MTIAATLRRAASVIGLALAAMLLAGCVLTSEVSLFSPEEADDEALPASFAFQAYREEDGIFTPSDSDDGPGTFTLRDGGYHAPDGSMTAYFLPSPDEGDYYMLVLATANNFMYGVARLDGKGILELLVVFDTGLEDIADRLPAGVRMVDGGLEVTTRADLDAVVARIADGTLPTSPLIVYTGPGTPPASIVRDGDWYRIEE